MIETVCRPSLFLTFMKHIILILSLLCALGISAEGYNRKSFHQAFLKSDLTPWHDYITQHINISDDSLEIILDLEYNYLAWASTKKFDDTPMLLGAFNRHIKRYEHLNAGNPDAQSDLNAFRSAAHVYAVALSDKIQFTHSLQAVTDANKACSKDASARALMHMGFMYFYRPAYAGGNKNKALTYLRKAEKQYLKEGATDNWNLRNTQMHIAQCLIKLNRQSEAQRYIRNILQEEPGFTFLKQLSAQIR